MLTSALKKIKTCVLRVLVKKINIKIMHWKFVKSEISNFMSQKCVIFNENFLFLTSLTIPPRTLVSKTHKICIRMFHLSNSCYFDYI